MNTFQIVRLIGEAPKELLSGIESSILTRMAFFGDREGKNIRPGIEEIVRQTKFCKRSVVKALRDLCKKNVIVDVSDRVRGSHKASCYEINIQLLQKKAIFIKEANTSSKDNNIKNIDEKFYLSSAPHALDSSAPHAPLPYTPHLEPILEPTHIEFYENSALVVSEKKLQKNSNKKNWKSEINEVFDYWRKVMNRSRSKIDKKRISKLNAALEHGFSVDELKKAVDGAKKSPFHRGNNDRGVIYDSIDLIFRNPEKIEAFISIFDTQIQNKNKNASTGLKLGFVERQKSQVNMLKQMGDKYFPHLSDNLKPEPKEQGLLK